MKKVEITSNLAELKTILEEKYLSIWDDPKKVAVLKPNNKNLLHLILI